MSLQKIILWIFKVKGQHRGGLLDVFRQWKQMGFWIHTDCGVNGGCIEFSIPRFVYPFSGHKVHGTLGFDRIELCKAKAEAEDMGTRPSCTSPHISSHLLTSPSGHFASLKVRVRTWCTCMQGFSLFVLERSWTPFSYCPFLLFWTHPLSMCKAVHSAEPFRPRLISGGGDGTGLGSKKIPGFRLRVFQWCDVTSQSLEFFQGIFRLVSYLVVLRWFFSSFSKCLLALHGLALGRIEELELSQTASRKLFCNSFSCFCLKISN